jgi:ADP-heptose:LPS heptosyltransferase
MNSRKKIKASLLRYLTSKKNTTFDINKSQKILILKYDRIGDMIVSTPIFRELKKRFPNVQISVLASKANKDVLKYNPYVSHIYTNYKNSIFRDLPILLKLRKNNFDVCIELEHSVIPHAIFRLKVIKPKKIISIYKDGRYGVKGSELKLYDYFTKKDKKNHFGKIWLDTLIFFGIHAEVNRYDFFIGDIERSKATNFINLLGQSKKIGINIEGSFKEKSIKKNELEQICKELFKHHNDIKIILLYRPEMRLFVNKTLTEINLDYVISSYQTNSIVDLAALVEQLDLVISPDTSIVHIASSFDKPIISIHENNIDSFRLWSPTSTIKHTVFAKSSYGLEDYSVDEIVNSASKILRQMELES